MRVFLALCWCMQLEQLREYLKCSKRRSVCHRYVVFTCHLYLLTTTRAGKWLWKKPRFLHLKKPKNPKKSKFRFFRFFIFWSNFTQIILNFIFLYCLASFVIGILQKCSKKREVCTACSCWVEIFVSSHICSLKSKKPKKNLKETFKNLKET